MSIEAMKLALKALDSGEYAWAVMNVDGVKDKLRQAIEQAEKQEPVAYMDDKGYICNHTTNPERWTPLYTAPPQREWVGLTDEEIVYEWELSRAITPRYLGFAIGIEQLLKEKNT